MLCLAFVYKDLGLNMLHPLSPVNRDRMVLPSVVSVKAFAARAPPATSSRSESVSSSLDASGLRAASNCSTEKVKPLLAAICVISSLFFRLQAIAKFLVCTAECQEAVDLFLR